MGLPLILASKTKFSEIDADDLGVALDALLPWNLMRRLDEEAPTHFQEPTGNRHAIDYETEGAPALHIRVQELSGLTNILRLPTRRSTGRSRATFSGFWKGS